MCLSMRIPCATAEQMAQLVRSRASARAVWRHQGHTKRDTSRLSLLLLLLLLLLGSVKVASRRRPAMAAFSHRWPLTAARSICCSARARSIQRGVSSLLSPSSSPAAAACATAALEAIRACCSRRLRPHRLPHAGEYCICCLSTCCCCCCFCFCCCCCCWRAFCSSSSKSSGKRRRHMRGSPCNAAAARRGSSDPSVTSLLRVQPSSSLFCCRCCGCCSGCCCSSCCCCRCCGGTGDTPFKSRSC